MCVSVGEDVCGFIGSCQFTYNSTRSFVEIHVVGYTW